MSIKSHANCPLAGWNLATRRRLIDDAFRTPLTDSFAASQWGQDARQAVTQDTPLCRLDVDLLIAITVACPLAVSSVLRQNGSGFLLLFIKFH